MSISSIVIKTLADLIKSRLEKVLDKTHVDEVPIEAALERHVSRVEKWSRYVQTPNMAEPVEVDMATVALGVGAIPRRFRALDEPADTFDERSLLQSDSSFILLGAPGAGKTTTIKRLSRHFFVEGEDAWEFQWKLPILLLAKEILPTEPVDVAIARSLALPVTETHPYGPSSHSDHSRRQPSVVGYTIGKHPLSEFIADLLNEAQAVVFIDGIDELRSSDDDRTWQSIANLHGGMTNSKLIATCRTGDFILRMEGVRVSEIEPLTHHQMRQVALSWLPQSYQEFLDVLSHLPYKDIATRPLFLCYLLAIYRNQKRLPELPRYVYKRIIVLAIEDWDKHQNLSRASRYAGFQPEQKFEFLASLSYQLTYQIRSTRFSHEDLVTAYQAICESFQLPPDQAVHVAHELEEHTGIIADSGSDWFEFSHLSLQEFLCADYLVRNPHAEKLALYLEVYPAPVAVATAMSSDPTSWLSILILDSKTLHTNVKSLFSRLVDERPRFSRSETFGLAVLRLLFVGMLTDIEDAAFFCLPNVLESLALALRNYRAAGQPDGSTKLVLVGAPDSPYYHRAPKFGTISTSLLARVKGVSP
jgi:hypothetical protein